MAKRKLEFIPDPAGTTETLSAFEARASEEQRVEAMNAAAQGYTLDKWREIERECAEGGLEQQKQWFTVWQPLRDACHHAGCFKYTHEMGRAEFAEHRGVAVKDVFSGLDVAALTNFGEWGTTEARRLVMDELKTAQAEGRVQTTPGNGVVAGPASSFAGEDGEARAARLLEWRNGFTLVTDTHKLMDDTLAEVRNLEAQRVSPGVIATFVEAARREVKKAHDQVPGAFRHMAEGAAAAQFEMLMVSHDLAPTSDRAERTPPAPLAGSFAERMAALAKG